MKFFGYTLLFVGFAAMNWKTLQAREIALSVVSEHMQRMPQQESYSREEVRQTLRGAVADTWGRSTPWFYFCASAIFAGGVLLDVGAGRKRVGMPTG